MTLSNQAKERLEKSECELARIHINSEMFVLIQKSADGEITISDYVEELETLLTKAKEYNTIFNNSLTK